ncbi:ATP-binding protein [Nonomuraea sp. NPDC059194]|uniref:ATP-binding protein n=1 Tax=Nonomuraea sp. NPDC059194 TaxID=3346764 RepID=UPI00367B03A3
MAITVTCRTARSFAGRPEAIGQARAWTLALLPEACPRADDVALVVSELATNAILHTASGAPHGRYALVVEVGVDNVEITVADQGKALVPVPRGDGEFGRGLELVRELAEDYDAVDTESGRTVWCRLDWPAPGQQHPPPSRADQRS